MVLNISGVADDRRVGAPTLIKRMSLPNCLTPSFDGPVMSCAGCCAPIDESGETLSISASVDRVTYVSFSGLKNVNSIEGMLYSPSARAINGYSN